MHRRRYSTSAERSTVWPRSANCAMPPKPMLLPSRQKLVLRSSRPGTGLLRAQRLVEVTGEIVRSREVTVRQAQALYEAQIRSRVDLDLSRASLSRAQLQASEAENRVHVAIATLGLALGGAQDAEYILESPDLSTPKLEPVETFVEEALRLRPELQTLRLNREAAGEQLEFAKSQKKPLLNLAFSGGQARVSNGLARPMPAGGAGLALSLVTRGRVWWRGGE